MNTHEHVNKYSTCTRENPNKTVTHEDYIMICNKYKMWFGIHVRRKVKMLFHGQAFAVVKENQRHT